jgi:hypothetical protein
MKSHRCYLAILLALSTLALGCATLSAGCGLIAPSHHPTEDYTPVVAAATAGDLATVRDAVEKDPALLEYKEWDGATLLDDTVAQNHMDVAAYLLNKGTDVNAVKTDGVTALHIAARNGNIPMMNLLLEHGAKINALDSKGWTPLDRANKWGHPEAAEFLRQHGGHEGTRPQASAANLRLHVASGQEGVGLKDASDRFGVDYFALADHPYNARQFDPLDADYFVGLVIGGRVAQVAGQVKLDALVADARDRHQRSQMMPALGANAGLLEQFALGALTSAFPRPAASRGNFPDGRSDRVTILV